MDKKKQLILLAAWLPRVTFPRGWSLLVWFAGLLKLSLARRRRPILYQDSSRFALPSC